MGTSVFALFEYLAMGYPKNDDTAREFGRQLAKMHRATSDNGQHGFAISNTIGATHQPNDWTESWSEFFVEKRLKHMLRLCRRDGATFPHEAECIEKCRRILSEHEQKHSVAPSLVHGDLWSGNTGATADGTPCIFDPATYYGDRETDVAMTTLFGRQADGETVGATHHAPSAIVHRRPPPSTTAYRTTVHHHPQPVQGQHAQAVQYATPRRLTISPCFPPSVL